MASLCFISTRHQLEGDHALDCVWRVCICPQLISYMAGPVRLLFFVHVLMFMTAGSRSSYGCDDSLFFFFFKNYIIGCSVYTTVDCCGDSSLPLTSQQCPQVISKEAFSDIDTVGRRRRRRSPHVTFQNLHQQNSLVFNQAICRLIPHGICYCMIH